MQCIEDDAIEVISFGDGLMSDDNGKSNSKLISSPTTFKVIVFHTSAQPPEKPSVPSLFDKYLSNYRVMNHADVAILASGPPSLVEEVQTQAYNFNFSFHKETFLL